MLMYYYGLGESLELYSSPRLAGSVSQYRKLSITPPLV